LKQGWKGLKEGILREESKSLEHRRLSGGVYMIGGYGINKDELFEKLYTVEDLADAFGFAPQKIRNWVALRQIPFVRIGGKTRFRKGSIGAWLSQKERS
jgi:excisionase family DNA binding protein